MLAIRAGIDVDISNKSWSEKRSPSFSWLTCLAYRSSANEFVLPVGDQSGASAIVTFAFFALATSRSEEHTSELQSHLNLVCRLLLEKKKTTVNEHVSLCILQPTSYTNIATSVQSSCLL